MTSKIDAILAEFDPSSGVRRADIEALETLLRRPGLVRLRLQLLGAEAEARPDPSVVRQHLELLEAIHVLGIEDAVAMTVLTARDMANIISDPGLLLAAHAAVMASETAARDLSAGGAPLTMTLPADRLQALWLETTAAQSAATAPCRVEAENQVLRLAITDDRKLWIGYRNTSDASPLLGKLTVPGDDDDDWVSYIELNQRSGGRAGGLVIDAETVAGFCGPGKSPEIRVTPLNEQSIAEEIDSLVASNKTKRLEQLATRCLSADDVWNSSVLQTLSSRCPEILKTLATASDPVVRERAGAAQD